MARGLFIAIEGTDGSGLSTQTARLAAWFRSHERPVFLTKEPTTGPVGAIIRLALTHRIGDASGERFRPLDEATMGLLYAADRMDHLATEIEPRLRSGTSVVCDRYALSTYAFQTLGVEFDWLRALNSRARVPDLTIFIDVPPEISVERMRARGTVERYEQRETLAQVRQNFHGAIPVLRDDGWRIEIVDGTRSVDEVHTAIASSMSFDTI